MLKRMISLFMCVAMLVSMLPVQAIALETEEPTELVLETEPAEEETEAVEEETEPAAEETESVVEEDGSFDELITPSVEGNGTGNG